MTPDNFALFDAQLRLLLPETFDIVTGIHLDVINRPDRLRDPRHYQALAEVVELHWQHVIDELQSRLPGSFPSMSTTAIVLLKNLTCSRRDISAVVVGLGNQNGHCAQS